MQCTLGNIFGSTCNFLCRKGYRLIGDEIRACQAKSKWTGSNTTCEGINLFLLSYNLDLNTRLK